MMARFPQPSIARVRADRVAAAGAASAGHGRVYDAANSDEERHLATFKKYPPKHLGLGVGK